jgi:hypothetical protein
MESGDLTQWYAPAASEGDLSGGGLYNSGTFGAQASAKQAHSGQYSLRTEITAPPSSGVRAFRWKELRQYRELYASVWFYIPTRYGLTADPNIGQYWDIFQFKSRSTDGRNDPFWMFSADTGPDGNYYLRAGWGWGGVQVPGPYVISSIGGKNYSQQIVPLPVGRWAHLEAFIRQSNGFDGAVTLWQDGVELFDFQNVRTGYENCSYSSWCVEQYWSVNNYSDGLSPSPSVLYIDDAAIATSYMN